MKELKGFERVTLKAGESKRCRFELPVEQLAFWNRDMKYGVEPGKFQLWVAGDSASGDALNFEVR